MLQVDLIQLDGSTASQTPDDPVGLWRKFVSVLRENIMDDGNLRSAVVAAHLTRYGLLRLHHAQDHFHEAAHRWGRTSGKWNVYMLSLGTVAI